MGNNGFGAGMGGGSYGSSYTTISYWAGNATQTSYRIGDEMYGEGDFGIGHLLKIYSQDFNNFADKTVQKFTDIANNQYFSVGHLITSESVSRFGAYALGKALAPDYSVNYTVLDKYAKPSRLTTVLGKVVSPNTARALSTTAKYAGYGLAAVSFVATELQYADGQIGETERWANHIMTGVGLVPTPWTIGAALIYGAVTGGHQAVTGRSIFNDMGLGPQK